MGRMRPVAPAIATAVAVRISKAATVRPPAAATTATVATRPPHRKQSMYKHPADQPQDPFAAKLGLYAIRIGVVVAALLVAASFL